MKSVVKFVTRSKANRFTFSQTLRVAAVALAGAVVALLPLETFAQNKSAAERLDPTETHSDEVQRRSAPSRANQPWVYRFHVPESDQKFLTYGAPQGGAPAIGFWPTANAINWRYNDSGRPSGLVASSQAALDLINLAMSRWTSQCGVRFNYLGTTTAGPSLATGSTFDSTNVIGWGPISGNTTGITGIGGSGTTITEADIVLNNLFNPDLQSTIIHEVGHFLGLRHSDVSNVMMSGPPLTVYSGTTTLQTDDINGCRSMFGGPTATNPTISGTAQISSGGSSVNGASICASPSSGVTCSTVNASGAYSCTVPSGWTGTLHLQAGNLNRVAARRYAAGVTTSQSAQNFTVFGATAFSCNLDIDNNGLNDPSIDGVMILRKLFGYPGTSQAVAASSVCAQRTSTTDKANYLGAMNYDFDAGGAFASREGLVLLRLMLGIPGTQAVNGTGLSWAAAQSQINSFCGTAF
jgi:hypothetical protein